MRVVRQEGLNLMTQLFTVNRAKNSRSQGQTKKKLGKGQRHFTTKRAFACAPGILRSHVQK